MSFESGTAMNENECMGSSHYAAPLSQRAFSKKTANLSITQRSPSITGRRNPVNPMEAFGKGKRIIKPQSIGYHRHGQMSLF